MQNHLQFISAFYSGGNFANESVAEGDLSSEGLTGVLHED
jgi:hypothetical protein